ncbi:MAG TPA: hypothetical protein VN957_27380 [Chthoniobacterales bacterium]|nr:hypothetical protein [Chthoniobacterales bacterium]
MKDLLLFILGALSIAVAGLLIYLGWLLHTALRLLKAMRRVLQGPEVARDGEGKRIRERL